MLNLNEFKTKADRLTDLLPWAALIDTGVILNKDGSFQQTLQFRGPDLESSTEPQLVAETARLNNALKRLGSGWAIYLEGRRQQALGYPEEGHFKDPISWLVDAERRDLFEAEKLHFESEYFLTFQYLPPKEIVHKTSKLLFKKAKNQTPSQNYTKTLDYFKSTVTRLCDILSDFMPEISLLDDDETLTYLHNCISTNPQEVSMPDIPMYLDGILADTPLVGGLAPMLGDQHLRTLSILGFPSSTVPAILDQLNYLPLEYRWMTRFIALDKLEAEKILKNYRRQWFAKRKGVMTLLSETVSKSESALSDSAALRKSQDADMAMQELADDFVSFGYYTATITVWDKDPEIADDKQREVERIINGLGFTTINETLNSVEAWLSSLPGVATANVRMPLIHTLSLAHLVPFSALWSGPKVNKHLKGPVLMTTRTKGHTPFRFDNYVGDVGHQMVIGPTGSGKSVLLNMMALQFLRYQDAAVCIFDKGGSFLASTSGVGGQYYDVGSGEKGGLVFQPLAHIDQMEERVFAASWIAGILENENIEITPKHKEAIWNALTNLANTPKNQRTLTGLKALIQDKVIRQALQPYTLGGPYGEILDSDHEVFYDKAWQCFEMETLMQMPNVVAPVLSYIFHVLEKRMDGRPTMIIIDEAWLFLDHPIFSMQIRAWLKTLRKKNACVIFATQSVDDALNSKISSSLLESCPSRLYLPNDRALEPSVRATYEGLGLNDKQIQIISHATPKQQYYFVSQRGNSLFDLGLGEIAIAFCGQSKVEDKKRINELLTKFPAGIKFATEYLQQCGLDYAVDIIDSRTS